jgi:class III poly(R)-hydroxyalkanoic acid synthase PhaE subunit
MSNPFAPDEWVKGWQEMQQQFARTWQDAGAGAAGGANAPLQQAFEMWSQLAGAGISGNPTLERMVDGARQMVAMMQAALAGAGGKTQTPGADWSQAFAGALGGFDLQHNPAAEAMRQASGAGTKSFEQLFAQFSEAAKPLSDSFAAGLHVPTFGYSRESQARNQQLMLAMSEQSQHLDRYQRLMLDASRRALGKLELKLAEHSEPGRQLKSFREIYDTWIDAAEEGYAEVALSDEFRSVYGALVNAQMRVRQHVQQEIERSTGGVGMPTRTELDAVHRKLAEIKRRVTELEHEKALAAVVPIEVPIDAAVEVPPQPSQGSPKRAIKSPVAPPAKSAGESRKRASKARIAAPSVAARRKRKAPPKLQIVAGMDARVAPRVPKQSATARPSAARKSRAATPAKLRKPEAPGSTIARGSDVVVGGKFADRLAALRKAARKQRKGVR